MSIFSPPRDQLHTLPTPLNPGEVAVCEALAQLDDEWTIYVQPRIGLQQPDFVAVHPRYGVTIVEVKHWATGIYRRTAEGRFECFTQQRWQPTDEDPFAQAQRYRRLVFRQFYADPGLSIKEQSTIRSVVVLPEYSTAAARRLVQHVPHRHRGNGKYIAVWGRDGLDGQNLVTLSTGYARPRGFDLPQHCVQRLGHHLAEPECVAAQRRPLTLSANAREIAENRAGTRMRRVRGPAGCGKSLALASRAANLAAEGKRVLVVGFNITLGHHLRDLAARQVRHLGACIRQISFTHFHGLLASLASSVPRSRSWDEAWDDRFAEGASGKRRSAQLFEAACTVAATNVHERYDAVLVDEGQDFTENWWNFLRHHMLKPGGEMLLVVDVTQDLYKRSHWTRDESMKRCGFHGRWKRLSGSYRMPPDLTPIVAEFCARYLSDGETDPPTVPVEYRDRRYAAHETTRRWINVTSADAVATEAATAVDTLMHVHGVAPADITLLTERHEVGLAAVAAMAKRGHRVQHVFTQHDGTERRTRKYSFWGGYQGVKACTVHSYKGWESRGVVLCIQPGSQGRRLGYIGLTRVQQPERAAPAVVYVLNMDRELDHFASAFERSVSVAEAPGLGGQYPMF